jgi:hypothetical protein
MIFLETAKLLQSGQLEGAGNLSQKSAVFLSVHTVIEIDL